MKTLIAGYYGFGNLGDELILRTLIQQLREKYKSIQISVLSADPIETKDEHKVRAYSRWNPFSVIAGLWRCDLFLLGGGGLLQDKTSLRSLLYYLSLVAVARFFRTPVILYALGVDSLSKGLGRVLVRRVLSLSGITITVRDNRSMKILSSVGIPEQTIHVTRDPVFSSEIPKKPTARYKLPKKSVLIIPRLPCPGNGDLLIRLTKDLFKNQKGLDVKCMLFHPTFEEPFLVSPGEPPLFTPQEYIFKGSMVDMLGSIGQHDFIVSSRFHGLVLAARAKRPFMGIGDPDKLGSFCELWGQPFVPWSGTDLDVRNAVQQLCSLDPNPKSHDLDEWRRAARRTLDFV